MGKFTPPENAETLNATGKFLIPGLWDMHVHVHWYEKDYLPLFSANGVTGTRQMYGAPMLQQWRKEIEAGQLLGPHMFIASPIVDGPKPVWPEHLTGVLAAFSSREAELLKSAQETIAAIDAGQLPSVRFCGPEYRERQKLTLETYSPQKAETVFGELKKASSEKSVGHR